MTVTIIETVTVWISALATACGSCYGAWRKWLKPLYQQRKKRNENLDRMVRDVEDMKATIDRELKTNGGKSVKDILNRLDIRVAVLEGKHHACLSHLEEPIWEADANGNCVWVNRAFTREFGYSLDQTQNAGWITSVCERLREAVKGEWESAVRDRRSFSMEYCIHTADGRHLRVHGESFPVTAREYGHYGFICTVQVLGEDDAEE